MASDNGVAYASAVSLLDLYRRKALSPVEATRLILVGSRAAAQDQRVLHVDRDGALAAARASEARWLRGEAAGLLDGVPVTIKDLILMRGFPTRRGSRLVEPDQDWSEDAPATARLREAGAVIIGKTTMPEFGWKALGDSPLTGITRNPWDLAHSGRQQRRRGGGLRRRARAVACRQRWRRLDPIPCAFTGIWIEAELWPGARPSSFPWASWRISGRWPEPCGRGAVVGRAVRPRPPRSLCSAARGQRLCSGAGRRRARPADRLQPDPRLRQGDPEIAAAAVEARGSSRRSARSSNRSTRSSIPARALFTLWAAGTAKLLAGIPADRRELIDPGLVATAEEGERISASIISPPTSSAIRSPGRWPSSTGITICC